MAHELNRLMTALSSEVWLIDEIKGAQIAGVLEYRLANGPRADKAFETQAARPMTQYVPQSAGVVAVIQMHGTIMPRANMMSDISGGVSLQKFQAEFRQAAEDPKVSKIVLDMDSPGGFVSFVQETAEIVASYRNASRPIIAYANPMIASAAYWIACAADEIISTHSGEIGAIGVFTVHQEISEKLKMDGINVRVIRDGIRKAEGHPAEKLSEEALKAIQSRISATMDDFASCVAKYRGIDVAIVKADPEMSEQHYGGGRSYLASEALRLGMIDRIETFEQMMTRLGNSKPTRSVSARRRRLALI